MTAFVYLLHFERPYPAGKHPQHYLGVAANLEERVREHQAGSSKSRLTRACRLAGIAVQLVWSRKHPYPKAAFDRERRIKQSKKSYSRLCPLCKEAKRGQKEASTQRAV